MIYRYAIIWLYMVWPILWGEHISILFYFETAMYYYYCKIMMNLFWELFWMMTVERDTYYNTSYSYCHSHSHTSIIDSYTAIRYCLNDNHCHVNNNFSYMWNEAWCWDHSYTEYMGGGGASVSYPLKQYENIPYW